MSRRSRRVLGLSSDAWILLCGGLLTLFGGMATVLAVRTYKESAESNAYLPPPDPFAAELEFASANHHPWAGTYHWAGDTLWLGPSHWSREYDIADMRDTPTHPAPVTAAGDHIRLHSDPFYDGEHRLNDLVVVPWSRRTYLIPSVMLGDFAAAVNDGIEPRDVEYEFLPTVGFLREGDTAIPVNGKPGLPASFMKDILDHEVAVKAVSVETRKRRDGAGIACRITFDGGRSDGLYVGARLRRPGGAPYDYARVARVSDKSAVALFFDSAEAMPPRPGSKWTTARPNRGRNSSTDALRASGAP